MKRYEENVDAKYTPDHLYDHLSLALLEVQYALLNL